MPNENMIPIPTAFNEPRAIAAATVLLKLAGGEMEYMRLLKLLYMSDRLAWDRHGSPITGDMYVSMSQGPVLSRTYNLIKEAHATAHGNQGAWARAIAPEGEYSVRLGEGGDEDELSDAEVGILAEVHNRFRKITNVFDLVSHLHQELTEWEDPGRTSRPLPPHAILEALGKEPTAIARIARAQAEHNYLDAKLGPR